MPDLTRVRKNVKAPAYDIPLQSHWLTETRLAQAHQRHLLMETHRSMTLTKALGSFANGNAHSNAADKAR